MSTTAPRFSAPMIVLSLLGCTHYDKMELPPEPGTVRVTVTIQNGYMPTAEVMAQLRSLAGVPVRDVTQLTDTRYRMTLVCPDDAAACRAGAARIAADRSVVLGVKADPP